MWSARSYLFLVAVTFRLCAPAPSVGETVRVPFDERLYGVAQPTGSWLAAAAGAHEYANWAASSPGWFTTSSLSYSVHLADVGCRCNGAVYLVPMARSPDPGQCAGDHYCDANGICGVRCAELDAQEANKFAFRTTTHGAQDAAGTFNGLGGGASAFSAEQYGPGAACVDTNAAFDVNVSFALRRVHETGAHALAQLTTTLSQSGCSLAFASTPRAEDAEELGEALSLGVTPVLSFWADPAMDWLDGHLCTAQNPEGFDCGPGGGMEVRSLRYRAAPTGSAARPSPIEASAAEAPPAARLLGVRPLWHWMAGRACLRAILPLALLAVLTAAMPRCARRRHRHSRVPSDGDRLLSREEGKALGA